MGKLRRGVEGSPGGGSKSGLSYQLGDRQAGESLALHQGPQGLMEVCVEACVLVNPRRRQSRVPRRCDNINAAECFNLHSD